MVRLGCLVVLAAFISGPACAQVLTVSGEVRQRTELDDRDVAGAEPAAAAHLLRTRLGVSARPAARVRVVVQVQDARLWGGEDPALALGTLDADADQFDLHQGFFELDSLAGQPLALRVGRQELAYGNERLVGALGWANVGRSFDAARLRWSRGAVAVDVFAAQLVTAVGADAPQAIGGVFASWTGARGTVEAFAFGDGDAAEVEAGPDLGDRRRQRATAGVRAAGRLGPVGFDAELIGQAGAVATAVEAAPRDDVRAYLASAEVSTSLGPARLAVGATRLSGDDDPADGVDRRFDTLFATNHKFYGAMDYFPRLAGPVGLDDLFVSASGRVGTRWSLRAAAHGFWSAADLGNGRALGQEVDLGARYALAPTAAVEAGVSAFRATDRLAADKTTAWGYLMTTVGF
jgi:hypothetical protein